MSFAALWIIGLHLGAHRLAAFDKHLYFTHAFVSILVGISVGYVLHDLNVRFKPAYLTILTIIIIPTPIVSAVLGYGYGYTWENTNEVNNYLSRVIRTGDYILSEEGPTTMLATYDQNHPLQTTTFDWYEYQDQQGIDAYAQAVKDAHFNYILLYKNIDQFNELNQEVQNIVESSKDTTYQPVYQDQAFIVYKREYP